MKSNRSTASWAITMALVPLVLSGCSPDNASDEAVGAEPTPPVESVSAADSGTPLPTDTSSAGAADAPTGDPLPADVGGAVAVGDTCSQFDFSAVLDVYPKLEGPRTKAREDNEMFDCFLKYPEGYEEQVIAEEGLDETLYRGTRTSFGMHFNVMGPDPSRAPVEEEVQSGAVPSELVYTPSGRTVKISMRADGVPQYEGYSQAQYEMVDDDGRKITVMSINFASHGPGAAAVDEAVLETLDDVDEKL